MSRTRIAVASLSGYLYLSGVAIAVLSNFWEGLPLGPRDGQAFMAPGLLGIALMALGIVMCAALLLVSPRGPILLGFSVLGAFGAATLIALLRVVDLSVLLLAPGALFVALLAWPARAAAIHIGLGAALSAVAFAVFAYLSGPLAWMTRGLDGAVLVVLLGLALLSAAVALSSPRVAAV